MFGAFVARGHLPMAGAYICTQGVVKPEVGV